VLENAEWAGRVEDKLDAIIEKLNSQDVRVTRVESQIGFAKWLTGVIGSAVVLLTGWLINLADKLHK
jgi:hypothetical protein